MNFKRAILIVIIILVLLAFLAERVGIIPGGSEELPAASAESFKPGDVTGDGRVDVRDVVLTVQHALQLRELSGEALESADYNGDGVVDVRDAVLIMRHSLGLSADIPDSFRLGSEVLMESRRELVEGKKVGLVTNQSGVDSRGRSTMELLWEADEIELTALYAPEHGLDGKAAAGEYVESYEHEKYEIPVYSLYGETRMPTEEMLSDIDLLLYDIQDIGARSYTYISTLNYCMKAAEKSDLPVVVLDRPNPLGGIIVEGPVMEERFISFVGIDILPKAHGMTVGELARYFNREIGVELTVVPMSGYDREMIFQDTDLSWVQTSPNIPDIEAVFGYMVCGLGEGTGVFQADTFKWIGGKGLDEKEYAKKLNAADLEGIEFIPERRDEAGGVRLKITDFHRFNPAEAGIYALSYAFKLGDFVVPESNDTIVMFDKIMGTDKMGQYLKKGLDPEEIMEQFAPELEEFKEKRKQYLLSEYDPKD